jgi:hypothetical protein
MIVFMTDFHFTGIYVRNPVHHPGSSTPLAPNRSIFQTILPLRPTTTKPNGATEALPQIHLNRFFIRERLPIRGLAEWPQGCDEQASHHPRHELHPASVVALF